MIKQESRAYFKALGAHVATLRKTQQRFVIRIIDVLEADPTRIVRHNRR
jgi:hypothetical protein